MSEWARRDERTTRSEADFVHRQGWKPGTVLEGKPVVRNGQQIESGKIVRITAIGEQQVLAREVRDGVEDGECAWTFTLRQWRVMP